MATYTNDILFIQALDSYSYDLEQCIQKLQYILGGDDHAGANYLMGKVYHEQAYDYEKAREYYHRALCVDHEYVETYYDYTLLLINICDFDEAAHVLEVGFSLPQTDKARLHYLQAMRYEKLLQFKAAKKSLKAAKQAAMNSSFRYFADDQLRRVDEKSKVGKKSKKKKSKRKNKTTSDVKFTSMLD
ncbi:MAG: tetratricopeptide repeat protein [Bacteroidota bacterium]